MGNTAMRVWYTKLSYSQCILLKYTKHQREWIDAILNNHESFKIMRESPIVHLRYNWDSITVQGGEDNRHSYPGLFLWKNQNFHKKIAKNVYQEERNLHLWMTQNSVHFILINKVKSYFGFIFREQAAKNGIEISKTLSPILWIDPDNRNLFIYLYFI